MSTKLTPKEHVVYQRTGDLPQSFLDRRDGIDGKEASDKEASKPDYPKHIGGGYYKLSDGTQLRGKKKAHEAEEQL